MSSADPRGIPLRTVLRLGYVPRWLVCGPFPAGDESDVYRLYRMGRLDVPDCDPLGGELLIEPASGLSQMSDAVAGRVIQWSEVETSSEHLGISSLFPDVEYGLAYAAAYLESKSEKLLICDFRPHMLGRMIVNHEVLYPDSGLIQIRLRPGRNVILTKVLGGSSRGVSWGLVCKLLSAKRVGDTGLAFTAPRFTGFFRGSSQSPEAEAEFALANVSSRDLFDVALRLSSDGATEEIMRSVEVVRAGETALMRHGLPVPKEGMPECRLRLDIMAGNSKAMSSSVCGEVRPPGSDVKILLGIGFHCDPIWTNTQSMYNDISLHNVTQYLDFCRADPELKVIFHELDYFKPYMDFYPSNREYIRSLARDGRIVPGGSYNEPNEKNVSGEQIVRNILYGRLFASSQFGVDPKVYHAWDVFGHVAQLSQILAKSGFIGTVWSKLVKGFPPVFRHMSLDGTTLPHRRVEYGYTTFSMDHMRERAYTELAEMQSLGHSIDLRMDCNDFKSPTGWLLGRLQELRSLQPSIEAADPASFFEGILREESSGVMLPTTSRDPSQYHIGTSQSRIELKIANRLGEAALYSAELLSTLASLMGRPYPDLSLDKAWRQLLFNSHHDAITGTSCDKSYLDMLQGYREALALAGREMRLSAKYLADRVDTTKTPGAAILLFNTLNWKRTDVVHTEVHFRKPVRDFDLLDPEGRKVQFCVLGASSSEKGTTSAHIEFVAKDLPSVGYRLYSVIPKQKGSIPKWKKIEGQSIENDFFKITVDPAMGGGISSLLDKRTGRELVPAGAGHLLNEIAAFQEKNDRHEPSWELHTTGERIFAGEYPAQVHIESCGPAKKLVIRTNLGELCDIQREIWLRNGIDRVEFRTELLGYDREDDLFVALFPNALEGAAPTYEERFGAIIKHPGRRAFDYRTWRMDAFSDCVIHSSQNFFDMGSTTRIRFVDHHAQTIAAHRFGSVALVLPHSKEVQLSCRRLQRSLANRGVLTTPFFDDDDTPRRENLRHQDSTEPRTKNDDLANTNFRISVGLSGNNNYSFTVLEALDEAMIKKFRDRVARIGFDFIFTRDRNVPDGWDPVPVLVIETRDTESLEKAVDFLAEGLSHSGDLILPEHANFLGQSRVEDYGISVLNRGNMACSVEPDGTMTLFLKHTANWSRVHLGEKFVPEKKGHVFVYAVYPHQGSWREARSYRRGWEFNVPVVTAETGSHKAILPESHSFLTLSGESLVLSAMKPAGNPVAGFEHEVSDASKGIVVRAYEAEGKVVVSEFAFGFPVAEAWKTDLMENRTSSVNLSEARFELEVNPFGVETFEVRPTAPISKAETQCDVVMEPVQPIYSKYWKENLGPAPIGYQPVAISIVGVPLTEAGGRGTTVNRISVNIANNYVDRIISGHAVLEAPEGWGIEPGKIWYEVPPLGNESYEVVLSFSGLRRTGLFRVRLSHDGQDYEDVIEIGEQSKLTYTGGGSVYQDVLKTQIERALELSTMVNGNTLSVRLYNPYNEGISGGVALITSLENWSMEEVGPYSRLPMGPAVQRFELAPKSFKVLEFELGDASSHYWAYAKLFYMGRTEYRRVK